MSPSADRRLQQNAVESAAPVRRAVVFANPSANGYREALVSAVVEKLRGPGALIELLRPTSRDEAIRALTQALRSGCDVLSIVGGDGTLNLALNVLERLPLLNLVPAGTANDLASELKKVGGERAEIDLVEVNGVRFATVGGVGIPAEVAVAVNRLRRLPVVGRALRRLGRSVYTGVGVAIIAGPERLPGKTRVRFKNPASREWQTVEEELCAVFVANQPTVAGNLLVSPASSNADGTVELCLVPRLGRLDMLKVLWRISRGQEAAEMKVVGALEAELQTSENTPFFGDGERLSDGRLFRIAVLPRALTLLR